MIGKSSSPTGRRRTAARGAGGRSAHVAAIGLSLSACRNHEQGERGAIGRRGSIPAIPKPACANIASLSESDRTQSGRTDSVQYARRRLRPVGAISRGGWPISNARSSSIPAMAPAHTNRGLANRQIGEKQSASPISTGAHRGEMRLRAGLDLRGQSVARAGPERSRPGRSTDRALRLNPESAQALHSRGLVLSALGTITPRRCSISTPRPRSHAIPMSRSPLQRTRSELRGARRGTEGDRGFQCLAQCQQKQCRCLGLARCRL